MKREQFLYQSVRHSVFLIAILVGVGSGLIVKSQEYKPDLILSALCTQPKSITVAVPTNRTRQPQPPSLISPLRAVSGSRLYQEYGNDTWDAIPQGPHHDDGSPNFTMMTYDIQVICGKTVYDVLVYTNPDFDGLYYIVLFDQSFFGFPLINTYQTSLRDLLLSDTKIRPIAAFVTNDSLPIGNCHE